jgi:hypothetical protein
MPRSMKTYAELLDLGQALGWSDAELRHAMESGCEEDDGTECLLRLDSGRELRCPAFPAPCGYVRVVQQGYELAYWDSNEWRTDPEEVMGALMGCASGRAGTWGHMPSVGEDAEVRHPRDRLGAAP